MKKIFCMSLLILLIVVLTPLSASSVTEKDVGTYSSISLQAQPVDVVYSADINSLTDLNIVENYLGVEKSGLIFNKVENFQEQLANEAIIGEHASSSQVPTSMKQIEDIGKDRIANRIAVEGPTRLDIGERFSGGRSH